AELAAVAEVCWSAAEREYQYFGCWYLRRYASACGPDFVPVVQRLIVTKPWWDTVDPLAVHVVGPLVAKHPRLVAAVDGWLAGPDRWLIRTALLHQLTYREDTDADRLFRYCAAQGGHPDFFVRKAIGWALREYAKTDPAAVRGFVQSQQPR